MRVGIGRVPSRVVRLLILPVTALVLWQLAGQLQLVNTVLLPPPSKVAAAALKTLRSGELLNHLRVSLERILYALGIALVAGVPLGIFMGLYRPFEEVVDGFLNLLRPVPPLAWIPLAILWFGVGEGAVVFITLLAAFFAVLLNTFAGVRSVDKSLLRAALSLGAPRHVLILRVVLPATLPSIFTGTRIALGVSWGSIVAGELVAATSGLGFMITFYREVLRTDLILVGMVSIAVTGLLMDRALGWLERRVLPWRVGLQLR
jgi:ABC-type nitrate/sulfonate/bicarbonate transport system permease component